MAEPTTQEIDLISILRNRVIADSQLDDEQSHDQHLLRWIRAREGDIGKAEDMFRRHLEWRKTNGIGPSLLDWKPSLFLTDNYRAKFCGYDDSGSPIVLFTFGQWDLRPALARGEKLNVIKYKDQSLERIMRLMKLYENQRKIHNGLSKSPQKITQFNCICDWSGFSLRYIMNREAVEVILESARSFEANYPETLKAAYNINCPKVFDVLFKLVKPFLSERTLSKIFIYDSNEAKWKHDILSNLPIDQVPVRYGGTNGKMWDMTDLNLDLDQDGSFFEEVFPLMSKRVHANGSDEAEREGFKTVQVSSLDDLYIPILIASPRTTLKWNVKVEKSGDAIDFAVQYENGSWKREVCTEMKHIGSDTGSIQCQKAGNYWIVLSNSSDSMDEMTTVYYKLALDISE